MVTYTHKIAGISSSMHRSNNWEQEDMGEYLTASFAAVSSQLYRKPYPEQTMFALLCAREVVPWERKGRTDLLEG